MEKRKMIRQDKLATSEETKDMLKKCIFGVLSTSDSENQPYGVPLSYVYVNDTIYFHCGKKGHKIDNLNENDKVCFTVVAKSDTIPEKFSSNIQSAMVFGKAEVVVSEEEREFAFIEILKKYSPEFLESGIEHMKKGASAALIYKIVIEHESGKIRR